MDEAPKESRSSVTSDVRSTLYRPSFSGPSCNSRPGNDSGFLRDTEFHKWKTALFAELVTAQDYYHGLDSTDLLDCRVGGLSVAQMKAVDSEYETWMTNEIKTGSRRKGPASGSWLEEG